MKSVRCRFSWVRMVGFSMALADAFAAQPMAWASKPEVVWQRTVGADAFMWQVEAGRLLVQWREDKVVRWAVFDALTGGEILTVTSSSHARLSGQWLLVATTPEGEKQMVVEGWNLETKQREWTVSCEDECRLGVVVDNHLFVSDGGAVRKISVPDGKEAQRFEGSESLSFRSYGNPGFIVSDGERIYSAVTHILFGLRCDDLTRGWWNYCDAGPQSIDAGGIYGVSWNFRLAVVGKDGRTHWTPDRSVWSNRLLRYAFNRNQPPAVHEKVLVVGGEPQINPLKDGDGIVPSPYLFAFDKSNGKLLWKVPMAAADYVFFDDKLAVCAGHRKRPNTNIGSVYGAYGDCVYRLEVRDGRTGRLLWREARTREKSFQLLSGDDRFFLLDGSRLFCYR